MDRRGNVYVSELLEGIENANPGVPATLDAVGRIVKVDTRGHRTVAQVTQPSGLLYKDGALYASSGTLYGLFFQIPDRGKIVKVSQSAFGPES